jgi:hypothetical protein
MKHPGATELVRHATGREVPQDIARHVDSCPSCAAHLRGLSGAASAVVAASSFCADASRECLDDMAVAAFVEASLSTSERERALAHLARCGRCRSAVSSAASALAAVDVASAVSALGRTRRLGSLTGALGAAAVLVAMLLVPGDPAQVPAPHRDASGPPTGPVAISPEGPSRVVSVLRWHSVPGADRYRVTVFGDDGAVLYETTLTDTVTALPEAFAIAGRSYYWLVAARTDFDRWDMSSLTEFSVGGPP